MPDSPEEYRRFVNQQADQYRKYLKSICREAVRYHNKYCTTPPPLNLVCTRAFVETFMENFTAELERRQKRDAAETEQIDKRIQQTEEDILTHFFGPPFDPRNN